MRFVLHELQSKRGTSTLVLFLGGAAGGSGSVFPSLGKVSALERRCRAMVEIDGSDGDVVVKSGCKEVDRTWVYLGSRVMPLPAGK